jgi:hypothetical protein
VLLLHGHAHELRQDFGNVHNQMLQQRKGKKNADCANTIGMDLERMLFFVVHHPMGAKTHNIQLETRKEIGVVRSQWK